MFLNGLLLGGIGAAVIPLVLHLLNRASGRSVRWGAMLFLDDSHAASGVLTRWRQWILMAMRTAAIVLLAVAFARPQLPGSRPAKASRGVALVIVIDGSPSMTHPELTTTRFELARRAAAADLSQLHRGDQVGLIELGGAGVDQPLTGDLQAVASRIASLVPESGSASLAEGIRRADLLLRSAEGASSVIHLIADRQRSTWAALSDLPPQALRGAHVIATPIGSTDNENVSIDSIDCPGPAAVVGSPLTVRLLLHNWSETPVRNLPLKLMDGGSEVDHTQVDIPPHSTVSLDQTVRLTHAGSTVITARIASSGMTTDDTAAVALEVLAPIRVLMISHQSPATTRRDAWTAADFVKLALAPMRTASFEVQFTSDRIWPDLDLAAAQVIILGDTLPPDFDSSEQLSAFVRNGGGLLLATGANVTAGDLQNLRDDAIPFIPSITSVSQKLTSSVHWAGDNRAPAMRFLADGLGEITLKSWNRLKPAKSDKLIGLMSNNDPFAVATDYGYGKIVTLAAPLDESWSNFPRTTAFLPTLQGIVRYLAGDHGVRQNLSLGDPIDAAIDAPRASFVMIYRADGRADRVPLVMNGKQGVVRYTDTNIPGRYVLQAKGGLTLDYVVHASVAESDLSLLSDAELQPILKPPGIDQSPTDRLTISRPVPRPTTELAPSLIALAAGLLLLEGGVSQRMTRHEGVPA